MNTRSILAKAHAHEQRARKRERQAADAALAGRTFDARRLRCAAAHEERMADNLRQRATRHELEDETTHVERHYRFASIEEALEVL